MQQRLGWFMDACFNAKQAGYESDPWVGAAVGAGLGGLAGLAGEKLFGNKKEKHYLRSGLLGAGLGGAAGLAGGAFMGHDALSRIADDEHSHLKGLINRAEVANSDAELSAKLRRNAEGYLQGERAFQTPVINDIKKRLETIRWHNLEDLPLIPELLPKEGGVGLEFLNKLHAAIRSSENEAPRAFNPGNIGLGAGIGVGVGAAGGAVHAALSKEKKKRYWRDILVGAAAGGLGGGLIGSAVQPISNMTGLNERLNNIYAAGEEARTQQSALTAAARANDFAGANANRQAKDVVKRTADLIELQTKLDSRFLSGLNPDSPYRDVRDFSEFYKRTAEEERKRSLRRNAFAN